MSEKWKYKMITLCGSTKFKDDFMKAAKDLHLKGWIVLNSEIFSKADHIELDSYQLDMIVDMHYEKILRSDAICVINKNGYIGNSTRNEIKFALNHGKDVYYMEPLIDTDFDSSGKHYNNHS